MRASARVSVGAMGDQGFADLEVADAVRLTWNVWPSSRVEATKCVLPFAALYSPIKKLGSMPVRREAAGVFVRLFARWHPWRMLLPKLTRTGTTDTGASVRPDRVQKLRRDSQPVRARRLPRQDLDLPVLVRIASPSLPMHGPCKRRRNVTPCLTHRTYSCTRKHKQRR